MVCLVYRVHGRFFLMDIFLLVEHLFHPSNRQSQKANSAYSHLLFTLLFRKVKDESATGSSTSNRVRTTLTLSVEDIEYDTSACQLRVKGRNIQENQYVKVNINVSLLSLSLSLSHTHTHNF